MVGIAEMSAPISLDGKQSIRIAGVSACVIFILHQKIQKLAKCAFWYQLTWVVPDKVQRAVKWLYVCGAYVLCHLLRVLMVWQALSIGTPIFDPPSNSTHLTDRQKFDTGDCIGDLNPKSFWARAWNITKIIYLFIYTFLGGERTHLQVRPIGGFLCLMTHDTDSRIHGVSLNRFPFVFFQ